MNSDVKQKIAGFFDQYAAREWPAKHILIHAGDEPQGIYYIKKGSIRQYTIDHRGDEIVVNTYKPGAFLPMMWAFNQEPCAFFFESSEQSTLHCAPKEDVLMFLEKNNDVTLDLLRRMYSGLDGVLMRMVLLMSGSAYTRILHELIVQTRRQHSPNKTDILLPIKEYELGAQCGLSRETVSREFKKLKGQKLVAVDTNGITVTSLESLEQEMERQT